MAHIVMADDGIAFDGRSLATGPLGGAETAFVSLAEALAARGHQVEALSRCAGRLRHKEVAWRPLAEGLPEAADLYIANRSHRLILAVPRAGRRLFWVHNPPRHLLKWRNLWRLAWARPILAFVGPGQARAYPGWAPGGRRLVVAHGVDDAFLALPAPRPPPRPCAIFTSSPLRGLDWLLDLWCRAIRPRVPDGTLHVVAGPATYGAGGRLAARMTAVLDRARRCAGDGVMVAEPVGKPELADRLAGMRVMLYRGDPGETFCLAVAEAQAAGVPAVVQDVGAVAERVVDGETGHVAGDDAAFAERAVALLTDDDLWRRQHAAAIARQRGWGWDSAAAAFESVLR